MCSAYAYIHTRICLHTHALACASLPSSLLPFLILALSLIPSLSRSLSHTITDAVSFCLARARSRALSLSYLFISLSFFFSLSASLSLPPSLSLSLRPFLSLSLGASWMAEYGDPATDDWKYLRRHSAYHLLRHDCLGLPEEGVASPVEKVAGWQCPKVLFTTSTRDDRVHPGHARKMVRSLQEEAGKELAPVVYYWENVEGGHGGAADNKQKAHMWALTYSFLAKQLGLKVQ